MTAFVILSIWGWGAIDQPPVWDGAMGATPAALYLADSGMDYSALLHEPGYTEGGPNTHSTSLVTFVHAVVILSFGSFEAALPILHLLAFCFGGLLVAGVFRLARTLSTTGYAIVATIATLATPVVLVQTRDIYLDLPLATFSVWALVFAVEHRIYPACAALALGTVTKPTGVVLVPAVLLALLFSEDGKKARKLVAVVLATLPATAPLLLFSMMNIASPSVSNTSALVSSWGYMWRQTDLLVLIGVSCALGIVYWTTSREDHTDRRPWIVASFGMSYLVFFLLNPLVLNEGIPTLPRYSTMLFPPLIVLCVAFASRVKFVLGTGAVALLIITLALNINGALNPPGGNFYSLSERDLRYTDHLLVQRNAFQDFAELAEDFPSYYDHFAHFRFEYPEMGWTDRTPIAGSPVALLPRLADQPIAEFPDTFVLLYEEAWIGGETIQAIVDEAVQDPSRDVDDMLYRQGAFENHIYLVTSSSRDGPSDQ